MRYIASQDSARRVHPTFVAPARTRPTLKDLLDATPASRMVKFLPRLAMLVLWFPAALAEAANDWTQPCHYGECNWDLSSEIRSAAVRVVSAHYLVFTQCAAHPNADGDV